MGGEEEQQPLCLLQALPDCVSPHRDVKASDVDAAGQVSPGAQGCTQRSAACERKSMRALPALGPATFPSMASVLMQRVQSFVPPPPAKAITAAELWKVTSITKATGKASTAW